MRGFPWGCTNHLYFASIRSFGLFIGAMDEGCILHKHQQLHRLHLSQAFVQKATGGTTKEAVHLECLSDYLDGDFSVPFPLSREAILVVMVFFIMISWNTFPCRTLSTASLSNGLVSGMLNNTLGWGGGGV